MPVPAVPDADRRRRVPDRRRQHALFALLAVAAIAAVIADTFWYLTGRRYGTRVLRTLCRISLSPDSCVRQTEAIFERFGPASMLFAKFIPGFASVSTALAGAMSLRYWKFVLFDLLGALLWVGVAIGLGYVFRDAIADILETLQSLGKWGLVLVARRSARGSRRSGGSASSSSGSCAWTASPSTSSSRCWTPTRSA